MAKKTLKRKMRGGAWYNPMDWFSSDPMAPKRSWSDWWNSTTSSAENSLVSAQTSVSSAVSSVNPFSSDQTQTLQQSQPTAHQQSYDDQMSSQSYAMGGKKRRSMKQKNRSNKKSKKGGNIASNAAPVSGTQTAKPTYWIKGGTKRRHYRK